MDTFPFESWEEAMTAAQETGAAYFTFGPGGNTATIVLTILGFLVMMWALIAWVVAEDRELAEHAKRLEGPVNNNGA